MPYWNSVNIINYVKNLYAVLWGCRNLPNNKHEQGAWVLGLKENFNEAAKLLDQAISVDLNFSKSLTKDYILHNQTSSGGGTSHCSDKLCDYHLICKNDVDAESEEIELNK
jgi:hypothetical protein